MKCDPIVKTMNYGEKVDGLRKRYKEYLWDAEFRDTMGATVTEAGQITRSSMPLTASMPWCW